VKVIRRRDVVRLRLDPVEAGVLRSVFTELADGLTTDALIDPVRERLFPPAYRDDQAAAEEYRGLTEASLRDDRVQRLGQCLAELTAGPGPVEVELTPEAGERWIKAVNDLRLAVGTRLGVTEDEQPVAADDPEQAQWMLYHWLTAMQDSLVRALMGQRHSLS
jgi:hypothetical protein